jgi:hypothetical protein
MGVGESKHSFSLRCPKCQSIINNPMPAAPVVLAGSPNPAAGADMARNSHSPAPPYMSTNSLVPPTSQPEAPDTLRQLLEILQGRTKDKDLRISRETRRALICVTAPRRATLAKQLAEHSYQIYLAENCKQAVDRMREEHMHVILLDDDFALEENGFRYLSQELQRMRPALRRRVLVVKISSDARTLDHHAAFLQSVNLLVNTAELNTLAEALEKVLRHHNDMYREFYQALEVAEI